MLSLFVFFLILVGLGYLNPRIPGPYNVFYAYSEYIFWIMVFTFLSLGITIFALLVSEGDFSFTFFNIPMIILLSIAGVISLYIGRNHLDLKIIYNSVLFFGTAGGLTLGSLKITNILYYSRDYDSSHHEPSSTTNPASNNTSSSGTPHNASQSSPADSDNVALLVTIIQNGSPTEAEAASETLRTVADRNIKTLKNYFSELSEQLTSSHSGLRRNIYYIFLKGARYSGESVRPYIGKIASGLDSLDQQIISDTLEIFSGISAFFPETLFSYAGKIANIIANIFDHFSPDGDSASGTLMKQDASAILYNIARKSPDTVMPYRSSIQKHLGETPYFAKIEGILSQSAGKTHSEMAGSNSDSKKKPSNVREERAKTYQKGYPPDEGMAGLIRDLVHGDVPEKIQSSAKLAETALDDPEKLTGNLSEFSDYLDYGYSTVATNMAHVFNRVSQLSPEIVSEYAERISKGLRNASAEAKVSLTGTLLNISKVAVQNVATEIPGLLPLLNDADIQVQKNVSDILLNVSNGSRQYLEPYLEDLKEYAKENDAVTEIINLYSRGYRNTGKKTHEKTHVTEGAVPQTGWKSSSANGNNVSPDSTHARKESESAQQYDIPDTDTGIVGIPGAGKTVFLSILDLYMSEHGRELGLQYEISGNIPVIRSHGSTILGGDFPEGTVSRTRDRYSIKMVRKSDRYSVNSTITDIPGEDVMGPDIASSVYEVEKFTEYLETNRLSYLLSCRSLIFIIPAREFITEGEMRINQQQNNRNPVTVSYAYMDFFKMLIKSRDAAQEQTKRVSLRISRKKKKMPVLVVISQWDIVRAVDPQISPENFMKVRMREFYNALSDEADSGKINFDIMGTGIQSSAHQIEGITVFQPVMEAGNRPLYIGTRDVVSWIMKNNGGE